MTTDEVLLKLGVDNSKMAEGLAKARVLVKEHLGNGQEWAAAGEKAGTAFAKAFHAKAILKMGAFFLVFEMLRKLNEGFGIGDKIANMRLPGGGTWNSFGDEKKALEEQEAVDKKMAGFSKEKAKYKREEAAMLREIAALNSKQTDDERELTGLVEKGMEAERAFNEFKKGDGSDLDRLKIYKELQIDLAQIRSKELEMAKKVREEGKKAAKEKQDALEKEQDLKNKIARIDDEIARASHDYRVARDKEYDPAKPSLQDLAGAGFMPTQFDLGNGPGRQTAQHILYLDNLAKAQFSHGNDIWARQTVDQRNKEYDWLADRGMVPQRDKADERLKDIGDRIGALGTEKHILIMKAKTGQ